MNRWVRESRGVALMTALVGVILLTLTVAAVMNLVMRRFETTAFRSDRLVAFNADEGATQYAWSRLNINDFDPATKKVFQQRVRDKRDTSGKNIPFVISSNSKLPPDIVEPSFLMAGKNVTVEILWDDPDVDDPKIPNWAGSKSPGDDFPSEFQVRASTDYGT